ncbi:MAG: hypothetical protein Q8L79_09480 [Methylobacter sp.]|uniref:hypothetical protein n=1 Tax=Methylobacter sp. TaxID=2051955 RepID=UPI002730A969|nr:hypothetical protein [Methylobacter sp.]MDP1665345.1 hypothetical protein [Methylobacter sp.]
MTALSRLYPLPRSKFTYFSVVYSAKIKKKDNLARPGELKNETVADVTQADDKEALSTKAKSRRLYDCMDAGAVAEATRKARKNRFQGCHQQSAQSQAVPHRYIQVCSRIVIPAGMPVSSAMDGNFAALQVLE